MSNATNRWLDRLAASDKGKGGTGSDYSLAKLLKLSSPSALSNYRCGRSQLDAAVAIRLAELLDVHPMIVIAEVQAERARDEREQRFWAAAAKNAKKAIVSGVAILAAVSGPALSEAASQLCILCKAANDPEVPRRRPAAPQLPHFKPGRIVTLQLSA